MAEGGGAEVEAAPASSSSGGGGGATAAGGATEVAPGRRVVLCNLKARADLNGCVAVVESRNGTTGRWNVRLVDGEREGLAVRPEALTLE